MKILSSIALLTLVTTVSFGQTITISGTVNNQKGQPVPYAFVRDAQHYYATYADSTGTYNLKADPSSAIQASANSYQPATVRIDNKNKIDIVLPSGSDNGAITTLKADQQGETGAFLQARQQLIAGSLPTAGGGSDVMIVREGFQQEPTKGSRYLFPEWMPGFGISKKDSLIAEITNLYNYDKLNGNIIYTNDGKSMARVAISQIKNFSIYDKKGHGHVYENLPAVSEKPFVEVLVSTPKYKIFKKTDTKLIRADFHTDGVLEMGHRYDEYVDVDRYYVLNLADNKIQSMSLKKSSLKKLMGNDADTFIASQGSRDVDEDYVRDLGNSLSK